MAKSSPASAPSRGNSLGFEPESVAQLLERTSSYYHPKFDQLIARLNTMPTATNQRDCIRLCVEAVNMVLQTQSQIASELRRLERRSQPLGPGLPIRRSA